MFQEVLGLEYDPFAPGAPTVVGEPVKAALAQITGEFGRGGRAVVITGAPGTGKTLLLTLIQDSYEGQNLSVSRVDLAALFPFALADTADLLLIDEADSADPLALRAWLSRQSERPRSIVLACRSEASGRLCKELCAVGINLLPLSAAQAKEFMIERVTKAGRADLFSPAALARLIDASAGLPQAMRSLAGMAMFLAAYSQAHEIDVSHVEEAVRSQGGFLPAQTESAKIVARDELGNVDAKSLAVQAESANIDTVDVETPVLESPHTDAPVLSPCLADAIVGLKRERSFVELRPKTRLWLRGLGTGRELAAAVLLLAAIAIPQSAFLGFRTDPGAPIALASMTPQAISNVPPPRSPPDSLRGLERVAKAVLPRPVVLAIVPQGALQPISIPPLESVALPPAPAPAERRTLAALPPPALGATPRPSVASVAGAQAVFGSAPALAGLAAPSVLPPKYMTADAITRALLDTAETAGLQYDDEFDAFRACVFRRVSPGGAEQRAFWRAVEVCIRV